MVGIWLSACASTRSGGDVDGGGDMADNDVDAASGGDDPLDPAEQPTFCTEMCNHDLTCFGDDPAGCMADCGLVIDNFASGPARSFINCLTDSCESAEDQCLLFLPVRDIDIAYANACKNYFDGCALSDDGLCDLEAAEAGAEIKLYQTEYVNGYIGCLQGACGQLEACVAAL